MTNPSIGFNLKKADPTLADLMQLVKQDIMLSLNSHALGTIQSFNSAKQTAEVTINYKKTFAQRQNDGTFQPVQRDYPLLLDVPVVVLSGGNSCLTLPVSKGDTCILLFNDRDIDNWFQNGQIGPVASTRLHSLSDGMALVGIRSSQNSIADFDTERAVLRKGSALVGVGKSDSLVKIANDITTLKTVIDGLIDVIKSAATVAGGGPLSPTTIAALEAYKSTVGGLLE